MIHAGTRVLGNIDGLYKDLKFVFDLAGDEKGYRTLKETIDEFLVGVETDTVSLTLSRQGDGLELAGRFDEGILRFAGLVLSKFVKENLED